MDLPPDKPQSPHPIACRHAWARFYASRGWLVLPLHAVEKGRCSCGESNCRSPGKHPRSQHGVKDASADAQQINAWWGQWPDANVGIATGAISNLVVVDVDPRNGGDQSYAQLKLDFPGVFTELVKVRSGSSGTHLYYQHPGSHVPCRANLRPGIDVKADGGYIVAPPSTHVGGERYRFTSNNAWQVPLLPAALRSFITPQAQAQQCEGQSPSIALDSLHVTQPIKTLIRNGKPKGQRSEAIFSAMRSMIKTGHSDGEIVAVLMDPSHGLSEKPRDKGEAWLRSELKRAREKPDRAGSASTTHRPNGAALIIRRASEIKPEAIRWLWPQRIALGKLSMIAGLPGLGKSQVTADLAAIVSSGGTWTTGEKCQAGDAYFLSAEDDPSDTIRPRLEACGADLQRIHIIEAVKVQSGERFFNLKDDIGTLANNLTAHPGAKLIIIDPINAYLRGVDSHKDAEVRSVLAPLAKLAADHGVAVVFVTHLNKGSSTDPLARVTGSAGFGAAVRTGFLVGADKNDPNRRFLLQNKTNISKLCPGLAFHIQSVVLTGDIETSKVIWDAQPVTITASDLLTPSDPDEIDDAKETIEASLRVFAAMSATELPSSKLIKELQMEGIMTSAKRFKKLMHGRGIHQLKKSDANYYRKDDFVNAQSSLPP
jgi:putative DNA primase/helicase